MNPHARNIDSLPPEGACTCLLYTSDAADERSSVDLGGRRIIKKKKESNSQGSLSDNTKSYTRSTRIPQYIRHTIAHI